MRKDPDLSARRMAAILVFLAGLVYFGGFADYGFNREDEGTLLVQFWRWSIGQQPYTDFHFGYTPGVHFLHKTLMQWFGPSVLPGRILLTFVHATTLSILYLLTARVCGSFRWAVLAPLFYASSIPVFPGEFIASNTPYPVWYDLLFFSAATLWLLRLRARPTLAALFLNGALAGLDFTFKPNVGLFHLAAVAMVCLAASPRAALRGVFDRLVWWLWWLAIQAGVIFVFLSAPSWQEVAVFVAPVIACALLVVREAGEMPREVGGSTILSRAIALMAGFAAAGVPWMIWAYHILGQEWFLRRALFLGTGFEKYYYLMAPPVRDDAMTAGFAVVALWLIPRFARRYVRPWILACVGFAIASLVLGFLLATRELPSGFYVTFQNDVQGYAFAAATFVEWAAIVLWWRGSKRIGDSASLGVATISGTLLYLQIFPRSDYMHWVTSAPLLLPSAVAVLRRMAQRWSEAEGSLGRSVCAVLTALPILAISGIRLEHSLEARYDLRDGFPHRLPEVRLGVEHAAVAINAGQAPRYLEIDSTVEWIDRHTTPDEPVFFFPALDAMSFFALRGSGNRHGYYFPGWPGHDAEGEVLTVLEQNPPRFAVVLHDHALFFADAPAYYFSFADFFGKRYRLVGRFGAYAILARNDVEVSDPPVALPDASVVIRGALGEPISAALDRGLASGDPAERIRWLRYLGRLAISRSFAPLVAAFDDPLRGVRDEAVWAVPQARDPRLAGALLDRAAAGAFSARETILAIRNASVSCDERCIDAATRLLSESDADIVAASNGLLTYLPNKAWRKSFWWGLDTWSAAETNPLSDQAKARMMKAMDPSEFPTVLRDVAYAYAPLLGLGTCPQLFQDVSATRPEFWGVSQVPLLAELYLARNACPGPRLKNVLDWLPSAPILAGRVALLQASLEDPAATDDLLSKFSSANFAGSSAVAMWISSLRGGAKCRSASLGVLRMNIDDEQRIAAVWAAAALSDSLAEIAEVALSAGADKSPCVRETASLAVARWHHENLRRSLKK